MQPSIAIVLVAARGPEDIAATYHHLLRQTRADAIELVLVGPPGCDFEPLLAASDEQRFGGIKTHHTDRPIDNVDAVAAAGILIAEAPVVAIVEDHAYPEPTWTQAMLAAWETRDPEGRRWAAIGSTVCNANPDTLLSWANLTMAYGFYTEPTRRGVTRQISRHNITFDRAALQPHLEDLEHLLTRGGGLLERLQADGGRFTLEPTARVRHVNPSKLSSTLRLRVDAGRLAAAGRASRERWSTPRRALYVAAAPLLPLMRLRPMLPKLRQQGTALPRRGTAALLGCTLDGLGQALGFAFGGGRSAERLAGFEHDRLRHLTQSDRARLEADLV